MKNFLIGLLLLTTVGLAALYVHENDNARTAQAELARLKTTLADLQGQTTLQQQRADNLRERLNDMRTEAVAPTTTVATLEPVDTNAPVTPAGTNDMKSAMAAMFKSPEMREMIKNQQKAVFSMMIDKNFKDLFAALNLTPDQAASLKDLITKKMLVDADTGMQMISGDLSADQRTALTQQAKLDKAAIDEEIKNSLGGGDPYVQYQSYEKTLPDRMALGQFEDQVSGGPTAMTPTQQQQLLHAMSDERSGFKFTTDYSDQSKFDGDYATAFSDDKVNQYFTELSQLDQQYVTRAQSILSAEQLDAYQKFLLNQQTMQKAAMKMAASMFAPKSGQ